MVPSLAIPLKMGPVSSRETVSNHLTPRDNPEEGRFQFNCGVNLASRFVKGDIWTGYCLRWNEITLRREVVTMCTECVNVKYACSAGNLAMI
jgi:hypothetical protein